MEAIGEHIDATGELIGVIRHFYCIKTSPDFKTITQHLSPNLEMMLVFNFGDPARASFADDSFNELKINHVSLVGPLRKMLNYEVSAKTDIIAVVFQADGFYRLFQLPMNHLNGGNIIDPDVFFQTNIFNTLWKTLKNLPLLHERIRLLQDFALSLTNPENDDLNSLITKVSYFDNTAIQPVRAIAMNEEVSERTIQLRFKKELGYSPKELMRFIRFKQVISTIMQLEIKEIDWYTLVEEFGYHDQSHLIKDFHQYLGTTPQKFVREIAGKEFCVTKPGKFYS